MSENQQQLPSLNWWEKNRLLIGFSPELEHGLQMNLALIVIIFRFKSCCFLLPQLQVFEINLGSTLSPRNLIIKGTNCQGHPPQKKQHHLFQYLLPAIFVQTWAFSSPSRPQKKRISTCFKQKKSEDIHWRENNEPHGDSDRMGPVPRSSHQGEDDFPPPNLPGWTTKFRGCCCCCSFF